MIRLDAATVLLQWATGGLLFCWVTTRGRDGQPRLRLAAPRHLRPDRGGRRRASGSATATACPLREAASIGVVLATGAALAVSVARRKAGVAGERERVEERSARVTAMTGIERNRTAGDAIAAGVPAVLDLVAPALGLVGLVAGGIDAGDPGRAVGGPGGRRRRCSWAR